eukprot:CAMPEP_0116085178 /NCGR_PEP_ID=MMETSP0327-20121206/4187_1 /TAXON_ID=44447 /ORGANISM="Pseudo-nitzschia delicatissima, Strain B596" /LENGTH=713 /DNA_ID=CAMNT_0003576153 /DNA_START=113 /DNA_END=2251 /DNA_ORIENTATION=-
MSYYGPASQESARSKRQATKLSQYDYSQGRDYNLASLHRAGHFNRHNKRLRRTFRIVAWRTEGELQAVGKALLSVLDPCPMNQLNNDGSMPPTEMSPEEAFCMISVWKSRLEGLPHAIESTAALAQIYWRDSQRRAQRSKGFSSFGVSVTELRLAYSAAIVRCINGFADILQQQRAMAASVSNLCRQLGIPSWVVDTRHESAHNALPNLEVLRLSASTLLEFMRSEYWIPRCPEWNNGNNESTIPSERETLPSKSSSPVDFLLEYKACALDWAKARGATIDDSEAKGTTGKRKKKSSPPKTTILPYDPLFGEYGTLGDSSDEDDSDGAEDNSNIGSKLDKPVVNSIWGSSVGTNKNRYILLDISTTKKKRKDKKKQKKSIKDVKKKKGEKSPTDCAKLFIQSVSSLQEGYAIATQYLIWGGIGGVPMGQGALISCLDDFPPATPDGVTMCWQLYSPLVHVISRTWPGFAANMITNLVDCVLSIEDSMSSQENDTDQFTQEQDEGSTRKLYFLSAWIRLLLSNRFVAALDQNLSAKNISSKNYNPLELPLAQLGHLECLGYPLNSLVDRCRGGNKHSTGSTVPHPGLTETSRSVINCLETILGETKTDNFGDPETIQSPQDNHEKVLPRISERSGEKKHGTTNNNEAEISSGAMSLDEMEKLLLLDDNDNCNEPTTTTEPSINESSNVVEQSPIELPETKFTVKQQSPIRRPAW